MLFPLLVFSLLALWPFLEARATVDRGTHHLLDTPSQRPVRTGIGVTLVTLLALLLVAGGNDVFAAWLGVSNEMTVWTLRIAVLVAPPAAGVTTYLLCRRTARVAES